ncbi:hypothetical protein KC342_g990 [Hortaea werneckii]|nr:hypothetical protein KC342_g990 [Hortaea werneckii]
MPNSPPQNHDVEANDKRSDQDGDPAAPRSRISLISEDFSFIWFTLSMNTGILSILMHQLPYQVMSERPLIPRARKQDSTRDTALVGAPWHEDQPEPGSDTEQRQPSR